MEIATILQVHALWWNTGQSSNEKRRNKYAQLSDQARYSLPSSYFALKTSGYVFGMAEIIQIRASHIYVHRTKNLEQLPTLQNNFYCWKSVCNSNLQHYS